jgi:hypothetical protein
VKERELDDDMEATVAIGFREGDFAKRKYELTAHMAQEVPNELTQRG